MNTEADLLANCPDYLSIGSMLKATPLSEGERRFCYFEASTEGVDQQNEVVAAKALAESADYFRSYGNIDFEHWTLIGKPNPAKGYPGLPNYMEYEIGRPVEVKQTGKTTFVKAEIYSGEGQLAAKANEYWDSITKLNPPQRWYPSVGGSVLEREVAIDPKTGEKHAIIKKVRWNNIGVSKTPVNQYVGSCATVPIGAFAKSFSATLGGWDIAKALTAGYGTDSATLDGGAALRKQSLEGVSYLYGPIREKLSDAMLSGRLGPNPSAHDLVKFGQEALGLPAAKAAELVKRFMRDLSQHLKRSKK